MSVFYMAFFSSVWTQLDMYSITSGDKILVDWSTPLISEVYVKDKSEPCDDGDDPAIYFPWFGANHMCVDDVAQIATRGFSCDSAGMKYKTRNKKSVRTNFNDQPGFPMIQMSVLDGKKYCGKKIYTKNATDDSVPLTFRNIQFQENGWCKNGGTKCGNKFCVPSGGQCPLTDFQIFGAQNLGAGFEKSVPLGKDNKFVLAFKSDEANYPATMVQFALTQPCYDFFFSSGPQTSDNSIYQFQDFEFMFEDVDMESQESYNSQESSVSQYSLQEIYLIGQSPSDLIDRTNKCPKSRTNDLFVEQSYSRADDGANLPFSLHDIYAQNDIDQVLKNETLFFQGAYDATKTATPSLWYRPAYFFDSECETNERLSRESLLKVLRDDIQALFQDAKDSAKAGFPWTIVRLIFFFICPFFVAVAFVIPPEFAVSLAVIILAVLHYINTYYLNLVRSDIWAVIKEIGEMQGLVNECVSQDQRLDAKVIEKSIMDQVYSYTDSANTLNTILIIWNSIPIIVIFGLKLFHTYKEHHFVADNYYQRN